MLAEALHDTTDLAMNSARFHGDDRLLVRIFNHPRLDRSKSAEAKRPIYTETPYVQIMIPGNKDHIVIKPMGQIEKTRFPEHWRRFLAQETEEHFEGTLLEEWPGITRSQAEELRYLNIRTVEQLANVADSNAQNVMGMHLLKSKAVTFLEASEKNATAEKFADLEAKYEALILQMAAGTPDKPQGERIATKPKAKAKRKSRAKSKTAAPEAAQE